MRYGTSAILIAMVIMAAVIIPASATEAALHPTYIGSLYHGWSSVTQYYWNEVHDLTASTSSMTWGHPTAGYRTGTTTNKFIGMGRSYYIFDTTSVNLTDEITSQINFTFKIGPTNGILDELGVHDDLCLVFFYPESTSPPAKADYDKFGTYIYDYISLDDMETDGVYSFVFNDDGIIRKGGYTALGLRLRRDIEDNEPSWVSSKYVTVTSLGATDGISSAWLNFTYGPYVAPTPTPTPYPGNISVNLLEKYSNAALVNQGITLTPTSGGSGETKTSLYGETLHFGVVPGMEYWFNASRSGYQDYNETYTIPASPGIYNVYMERTLTPIANHSYAHFSVVDQTNGGLIPNAEIRLSDGQTKLTNSAGYTWFSVNNSEQINYYVSKPSGYWPAYGAMNLTADESILVALQRYTGPTATATMPGWTPVTVPTTGTGVDPVVTLSAQLRQQNVQEGMDVWYTNLPFISQFLFLLFIIGGLGLMAGGTRRN